MLPLPRPSTEPGTRQFDLDVLVVQQADNGNTERAKVVSRLFEEDVLTEDAVRIGEIRVDGTRYALAPDARAFGLRILRQGSSRANPYSNESLSLYVPQGPKLAKVLDGLELMLEQGEWDTSCTGSFETVRGSLSVARGSTGGYADLILLAVLGTIAGMNLSRLAPLVWEQHRVSIADNSLRFYDMDKAALGRRGAPVTRSEPAEARRNTMPGTISARDD